MSLVTFARKIGRAEAQGFAAVLETGFVVLRAITERLKDDGRLSGREGLEVLGEALSHHGILLGSGGAGKTPRRRHDDVVSEDSVDVRHPLHLRSGQADEATPEVIAEKLASMEALVNEGVCLECDGEPGVRVSRGSSELLS